MNLFSSSKDISSIDELAVVASERHPHPVDMNNPECDLAVHLFPTWRDGEAFSRGFAAATPGDDVESCIIALKDGTSVLLILNLDSAGDGAVKVIDHKDLIGV